MKNPVEKMPVKHLAKYLRSRLMWKKNTCLFLILLQQVQILFVVWLITQSELGKDHAKTNNIFMQFFSGSTPPILPSSSDLEEEPADIIDLPKLDRTRRKTRLSLSTRAGTLQFVKKVSARLLRGLLLWVSKTPYYFKIPALFEKTAFLWLVDKTSVYSNLA